MSLIPWKRDETPATVFGSLQRDMNRLFEDFFGSFPTAPTLHTAGWLPPVTTSETDKHVMVRVDLPGVDAVGLDVSLQEDVLTIRGEKKQEKKEEKENYHRVERSFGTFVRQVALPCAVDPAGVEAKLHNGVLEIRLPKVPGQEQPRKISIKVK